ncbi:restriction endonuclease subunit S [Vibrio harveyi]
MSVEFRTYLLSEIASKITKGTTPSKKDGGFSESGINYIKAESVGFDGRIDRSKFAFISEDVHHKLKRSQLEVNDILFSMAGVHLGKVALVEEQHLPANTNQALALIRPITSLVNPLYLLYFLQQREVVHFVNNATSQSAQPNINLKQIGDLEIRLPELAVQNKVVDILSSLDRKLVINTDINQNLESIAQTFFKSWFVDFDPVKAKMNGEQPEGMDAATASLFPEKLVESELGLIPEGWSVEEAKSQLDVLRGFSYKGKGLVGSLDEGVPMHNLNSVLEGGGYKYAGLKFYSEEFKEKFAIQEGDVLVANTEQGHNHLLIGYGAMVPKHLAHGFFSHHTYRVRPKKNSHMTPEFIERLFGKGRFARQVQGFTNGTTVNMLPTAGMEMPQFVVPPKALAQKFSELVKPMKAMIEENHKSNIELAKLRDTLLPKLLSGEIELGTEAGES